MKKILLYLIVLVVILSLGLSAKRYISYIRNGNLAMVNSYNVYGNNISTAANNNDSVFSPISNVISKIKNYTVKKPVKIQNITIALNNPKGIRDTVLKFPCLKDRIAELTASNKKNLLKFTSNSKLGNVNCGNLQSIIAKGAECNYEISTNLDDTIAAAKRELKMKKYKYDIQQDDGICSTLSTAYSIAENIKCDIGVAPTVKKNNVEYFNVEYLNKVKNSVPSDKFEDGSHDGLTANDNILMHKYVCPDKNVKCDVLRYIRNSDYKKGDIKKDFPNADTTYVIHEDTNITETIKTIKNFLDTHAKNNVDCRIGYGYINGTTPIGHSTNMVSYSASSDTSLTFKVKDTMDQGSSRLPSYELYTDIKYRPKDAGLEDTITITPSDHGGLGFNYFRNKTKTQEDVSNNMVRFDVVCCEFANK